MIWQFIINGLITGILYSLLAKGGSLVYNTTRIFHIAAAGIYVFAAYMLWFFVAKAGLPIISASLVVDEGGGECYPSTVYIWRRHHHRPSEIPDINRHCCLSRLYGGSEVD